jgi:hypothetical protein
MEYSICNLQARVKPLLPFQSAFTKQSATMMRRCSTHDCPISGIGQGVFDMLALVNRQIELEDDWVAPCRP